MSSVTVRLSEETNDKLARAIAKIGCTKTEFVVEAIEWALEREGRKPTPLRVLQALPRRVGTGMVMPDGVNPSGVPGPRGY